MFIFVTNKNDFPHADRYNGKDYFFQPGEKQMLSVDAAAHLFGFGREDKEENLVRLGWANRPDDIGVKWLAKFVFTDARIVEDADDMTVPEEGNVQNVAAPMKDEEPPARRERVIPSSGLSRPPLAALIKQPDA